MALVAEATGTVVTAESVTTSADEMDDSLMESEGLSLSSNTDLNNSTEVATTEGISAYEEVLDSTEISKQEDEAVSKPVAMQTEDQVEELASAADDDDDDEQIIYGEEEVGIEPTETEEVMEISSEPATEDASDNNKENTEESAVILPAVSTSETDLVIQSVQSPAAANESDVVEGEILTGATTSAVDNDDDPKVIDGEGCLGEDEKKEQEREVNEEKTVFVKSEMKPNVEDVKNDIEKLMHKSLAGIISVSDVKSELGGQIRHLKKSDLEGLIMDKIIEAITIHSHVGSLNQKLIQSNTQKDRLFHKVANLQRQVTELVKAVHSLSENVGRNPKNLNKANQPIRFYRSVGVQVVLEGALVPPATARQGNVVASQQQLRDANNKSVLKSGNNKIPPVVVASDPSRPLVRTVQAVQQPLTVIGNVNPGLKRPLNIKPPTISVADLTRQIDQNKIRRVTASPSTTPVVTPIKSIITEGMAVVNGKSPLQGTAATVVTRQQQSIVPQQALMRNPAAVSAMNAIQANAANRVSLEPGIVDLTDDDVTPISSPAASKTIVTATTPQSAATVVNGKGNVFLLNGLPYRLQTPPAQTIQNLQLITQNGGTYQLVTSAPSQYIVRPGTAVQTASGQVVRPVGTNPVFIRSSVAPTQQTIVTPVISGGQILMRPIKPVTSNTVQPKQPQVTIAPRQVQPQQQQAVVNAVPTRPSVTNGVATRVSNNTGTVPRPPPQPVTTTRIVGKQTMMNEVMKKFNLPPLPPPAVTGNPRRGAKDIPPRPELTLTEQNDGIVLSWNLKLGPNHAEIQTYQIYACQEPLFNTQKTGNPSWKRVGDVKALPLPMACTLSQFTSENRYHFIVRGVDVHNRTGPFCEPSAITLSKK